MRARHASVLMVIGLVGLAAPPRLVLAEDWVYESDELEARAAATVRFSTRFNVWISTFDRPPRACESLVTPTGYALPGGEVDDICPSSESDEQGVGGGLEVAFRVLPMLYLTAGIDVIYTLPEFSRLKNQVIVPVPFGILLTSYEWSFRPIVHATIMPILYLTDDARDYTLGLDGGIAGRLLDMGDVSFMIGYKTSDTMDGWQIQLALHPFP